ncbi:hypothetical protein NM208_g348 [Fusarium decemcellulare]|uniref:Uncharacterized protein n=1 Tax=Fusarium decemcellulare TaxID=57161 RepID=A0ACC1SZQ4_9HYPO|nr:hypothetical protein NM208_g348 [Fusarium decemcellulare]
MSRLRQLLTIVPLIGQTLGVPASLDITSMSKRVTTRDDDDFDMSDLSHITKIAAIGDSYSAGIGAGERLGSFTSGFFTQSDYACSRYDHAYPYLVNEDYRFGDKSNRNFQFQSCSGAIIEDVRKHQIPALDSDQQVIMLSAGGNDAELVKILNHCVYQWASFNSLEYVTGKLQESVAEKKIPFAGNIDWEELARGCDEQLKISEGIIDDIEFTAKIETVLYEAKSKLAEDGMIYYTGYGQFFADSMTAECDKVTWTTFIHKAHDLAGSEYLTVDRRKKMNELVVKVNEKIQTAVDRAGSNVKFIDYDDLIGDLHGRYCEAGVDESASDAGQRNGLMFYEFSTMDPGGSDPQKRSVEPQAAGTFSGDANTYAYILNIAEPGAEFAHGSSSMASASLNETNSLISIQAEEDGDEDWSIGVPNMLPDGYGRAFHPQILLHHLIADHIVWEMVSLNNKRHGNDWLPLDAGMETTCPVSLPKVDKEPECDATNDVANMESETWSELLDAFCETKPDLLDKFDETWKTSELGVDGYDGYSFTFELEVNEKDACKGNTCQDIMDKFKSCTYDSHTSFKSGQMELDCGTIKYSINEPEEEDEDEDVEKTPLEWRNEYCYPADEFGDHKDVHENQVRNFASGACELSHKVPVSRDDPFDTRERIAVGPNPALYYNVYWKEGCELENGETQQLPGNPLNEEDSSTYLCRDTLIDRYLSCNNGGVGGTIEAGCLVYEFKAYDE